jgi:hypothetical protein
VPVSIEHVLNLADLNQDDVVLACATAVLREVNDNIANWVDIPDSLPQQLMDFMSNEITKETTFTTKGSGSIGASIRAYVVSVEGKYGKETETRTTIRQRLAPRVNDLIDKVNLVADDIAGRTMRKPLIIVEDLDRTSLDLARSLFFDHSTTLNGLGCHVIYTFPIPLCYSAEFTERIGDYTKHFLLPNVTIRNPDGSPNRKGHQTLRDAVTSRVPETLFAGDALDRLISQSGGLMRHLVRFVRDAALIALTDNKAVITTAMAMQAGSDLRNDFRRLLTPEHFATLREAQRTKLIVPNEVGRQLLENLSLLEYQNEKAWCDVHPIVASLLPEHIDEERAVQA